MYKIGSINNIIRVTGFISALNTISIHISQNNTGIPVKINCTASFALNISHVFTGSERSTHRFFPSSDTDGTTISFIAAVAHIATAKNSGTMRTASLY